MLLAPYPSKNALATFGHTSCDPIPSVREYHFIKKAKPSIRSTYAMDSKSTIPFTD